MQCPSPTRGGRDCATRSQAPPSTIITSTTLLKLHSLSKQAGQISCHQTTEMHSGACFNSARRLTHRRETSRTSEPNHRLTLDSARRRVPFPLLQPCKDNWKSRFNKKRPQDTGAKVIYFITKLKPNRCLSIQQIMP